MSPSLSTPTRHYVHDVVEKFHIILVYMRDSIHTHAEVLKDVAIGVWALLMLAGCKADLDERIHRVHALSRNPSLANRARIEAMANDPDRDVRATVLVVLAGIDGELAKRIARPALDDPDGLVRAAAVPICGEGADDEMIRRLAAMAVSDPAWQVRAGALAATVPSDDPAVYEAHARGLVDPSAEVRQAALASGLVRPGLLPTDRVVDLVSSDPDPAWENRVEAVRALGASADRGAYAGLDAALSDPNEFVRATAATELRTLERTGVSR